MVLKWGNPPVRVKKGQIDFFAPRLALMISKTFISYKTYGTSLQMVKTNKGTQSSYYRPKMGPKMAIKPKYPSLFVKPMKSLKDWYQSHAILQILEFKT